jgi:hypothetical protein
MLRISPTITLSCSRGLIAGPIAHRQLPRWGHGVVLGVSLSATAGLVAALGREPDVPWFTGWFPLPYKIANAGEPSYAVVRSVRRPTLWAASDAIYALEHTAVTEHWGLPSLRAQEP